MRLLHTADWHLGRVLHGASLLEDQAHALAQLTDLARQAQVDAVLVCGDVYDRAVPPPEAVALLDDTLSRLVLDLRVPVVLIAGNHDSPGRLGFAARVLHGQGLFVRAFPDPAPPPIVLHDAHGPVHVVALPYAEPSLVRERVAAEVADHDAALRAMVRRARVAVPEDARAVLMAHAFVAGGAPCASERPLAVGGAGQVQPRRFFGFRYVALGHLHRPQRVGVEHVRYAGSLLKYSFEEAEQPKSAAVVELDARGRAHVECVPLRPRRDVRRLSGRLAELLAGPTIGESREDWISVTLHDREPVFDVLGKLRAVYPNVLQIERPFAQTDADVGAARDHRRLDAAALFARFFAETSGEQLSDEQRAALAAVLDEVRAREREAVS